MFGQVQLASARAVKTGNWVRTKVKVGQVYHRLSQTKTKSLNKD